MTLAGAVLRLVFSLAVVLTLMWFAARFVRQRQLGVGVSRSRTHAATVEVLARHGLSRSASVAVVRVAHQVLVLGVTDTSVQVLRELAEEDVAVDEPEPAPASGLSLVAPLAGLPGLAGLDFKAVLETWRERTVRRG